MQKRKRKLRPVRANQRRKRLDLCLSGRNLHHLVVNRKNKRMESMGSALLLEASNSKRERLLRRKLEKAAQWRLFNA